MARNITIAFAGTGAVKAATVEALLNDFLGFGPKDADGFYEPSENDVHLIFPASVEHHGEHLQKVVDWSEAAELPYDVVLAKGDRDDSLETLVSDAEHVTEVPNVDKKIVDLLKDAEGEKFLVLLWNDEDEHCEIILDLAISEGIKALDLTEGLDELKFGDDEEAPEPEPEPEPEKPVRGRRGSRRTAPEPEAEEEPKAAEKPARGRRRAKEEPLEETEVPLGEEPVAEEEVASEVVPTPVEKPVDETPAPAVAEGVDLAYLSGALQSIFLHLQAVDAANAYKNLADPVESPVAALAREALEHVSLIAPAAEEPAEEPKRGRGRPRINPETVGYLVNGDGVYRKAGRGRPKRGEKKVDLTAEEIADLTAKGMILDED